MPVLDDWINAACRELGLERGDIDQGLVLTWPATSRTGSRGPARR